MVQLTLMGPKTAKTRVYEALQRAGKYGVLSYELADPGVGALSWHRRLGDLRAEGFNIGTQRISKGVYRYYLIPDKEVTDV